MTSRQNQRTQYIVQDSEIDENVEIVEMEKRVFDDNVLIDGIESDVE
jgi:hypothetical protein